jgi:hypothetical protein
MTKSRIAKVAPSNGEASRDALPESLSAEPSVVAAMPGGPAPDPFSPESLRLQSEVGTLAVQKVTTQVPVRRPDKAWWVRAHPDPSYRLITAVLEDQDGDLYLIRPDLRPALALEPTVSIRLLVTACTRQGQTFLWPVRLPDATGKLDTWNDSARQAVDRASGSWVRLISNRTLGSYDVLTAPGELGEPAWPALTFAELLKLAFKDRKIEALDHPVLRRLRGEE